MARYDQRLQDRQLGIETDHGWNASQREHADGHDTRIQRAAVVQASQIGNFFALKTLTGQQQNNAKCCQGRKDITYDIEHGRAVGVGTHGRIATDHARHQTNQHETHLGNGGIS